MYEIFLNLQFTKSGKVIKEGIATAKGMTKEECWIKVEEEVDKQLIGE